MSLQTNNEFIKAFNLLDDILKDIYPDDIPSKLGVTRYLEDMKEHSPTTVLHWDEDYNTLKRLRTMRNQAVHDNMLDSELFTDEDIVWIRNFHDRVMKRDDPMSLYLTKKKKTSVSASKKKSAEDDDKVKPKQLNIDDLPPDSGVTDRAIIAFFVSLGLVALLILILYFINR